MAIDQAVRRIKFTTIDGEKKTLADFGDQTLLVVNVASKCGLTPQYSKLEALQKQYADQGFTVIGFPCNQFLGQEPGSTEDIKEFCSTTYGVTFPMMDKTRVNGVRKHPLYAALTREPDANGKAGKVTLELREVRDLARRRGVALPSEGSAGCPRGRRGDRTRARTLVVRRRRGLKSA